jgi:two-component system, response regulator YesN
MYKFLMVDDEEIVRRGFEERIDWPGSGFEFLPPCENGRDAISAVEAMRPDVVMTDVHMPHADGISVAAHLRESHPEIVVVILSGYDEFSYAQAAIRNNVYDYVLKPVSSRDLSALLARIKGKLDSERRSKEDESALRKMADRSKDLERGKRLEALLSRGSRPPSRAEAEEILGFDPGFFASAVVVADLQGFDERLDEAVEPALRRARRAASCAVSAGRRVMIVFEPGVERCARAAQDVAETVLRLFAEAGGAAGSLRAGVGRAYPLWTDAPRSRDEAEAALAYSLVCDASRPYVYEQGSEDGEALSELKEREERLCLALRTGAASRVPELARSCMEALGKAARSPQRVRHETLSLFSRARDELSRVGISPSLISTKLARDYYSFVESLDSLDSVVDALVRLAEIAGAVLEDASMHEPEWKILDFKELIAKHYADRSLSIGKVAARLSISESYLSKLIRRKMGTSFVDYLSDFRIERAEELLASSDMRSYEVAEAVGYSDPRYFASLFRKRAGMTPSKYRESMGKGRGT